jgi:hypothetical protein
MLRVILAILRQLLPELRRVDIAHRRANLLNCRLIEARTDLRPQPCGPNAPTSLDSAGFHFPRRLIDLAAHPLEGVLSLILQADRRPLLQQLLSRHALIVCRILERDQPIIEIAHHAAIGTIEPLRDHAVFVRQFAPKRLLTLPRQPLRLSRRDVTV